MKLSIYCFATNFLSLDSLHLLFRLGLSGAELRALCSAQCAGWGRRSAAGGGRGGWGGCFGGGKFNVREARENPFNDDVFR